MSGYHDRLQGTDRLLRIRRIRKAVFAGLFALGILLIFVRLEGEGASLKPFFLPVNGILEVALIMGLTASIIGLFLRNLEIRHALRDNQRFLMAKSSMTRAVRTAAFAIGLAIALLLAITPSLATTLFSDPLQVVSLKPNGSEVVTFTSPDALGLTFVTYATVGVTNGAASVEVKRDNMTASANQTLTTGQRVVLSIEPSMWAEYASWSLVFLNLRNVSTLVTFDLQKGIIPTLFSTVPVLVFLYGATQIGWWLVLRPIRDRTKVTSLRSAAEIDSGERVYDPSAPIADAAPTARPVPMKSSFVEPLPPTPSTPPPPPVPAPAVQASPHPIQAPTPPLPRPTPRAPAREPATAARLGRKAAAALEMKGDALTNLGRRPEALAAYEAAATIDPSDASLRQKIEEVRVDVPSLLSRALIASANGNYTAALNLFDEILEVEPSNGNALIGKAVAYRRSGKPQEALNCLDLVLGVQPGNSSALLNRGNILLEQGDLEDAFDSFDRLTQLYPNDEEAWAAQGEVLLKMGRDDDAKRAFTEALKLSPGDEGIQRRIIELEAAKAEGPDLLDELVHVKGIGRARAKALIDAGFDSPEDFAKATPKSLMAVKGVTRKVAEELLEHFRATMAQVR